MIWLDAWSGFDELLMMYEQLVVTSTVNVLPKKFLERIVLVVEKMGLTIGSNLFPGMVIVLLVVSNVASRAFASN